MKALNLARIHTLNRPGMRWMRAFILLTGAISMSACVTTQGPSGLGDLGPLKQLSLPSSDITDMFSVQMRELNKLMDDSKFEDAEQFFERNADYFETRFSGERPLTKEVTSLASQLWSTKFEGRVKKNLQVLSSTEDVLPSTKWASLNTALDDSTTLASTLKSHRLLKLANVGQTQADELMSQHSRVIALAEKLRPKVVQSMIQSTLESGTHVQQYVGNLSISNWHFADFPPFQTLALNRIKKMNTAADVVVDAKRLEPYLSQSSKLEIDAHYVSLIRSDLNADGKITLDEISSLGTFVAPFRTSEGLLKNIAKIGYVDLTGASFKGRNLFDFEIAFKKDVEIEFTPAGESTFKSEDLSGFDFVFVTDLTSAKVSREFKSKQDVKSRYKSGSRQAPNPNYVTAMSQYQTAMAEFQRAQINSAVPKQCYGALGCALIGLSDGLQVTAARKKVDEATAELSRTSQNVTIDVFSEYNYQSVEINTAKTATVNYFVIDVKGKQILRNDFQINDQERFTVAYSVREDDPEASAITRRFKAEDEVTNWEKRPVSVPLSSLFGTAGLKSATAIPFEGVEAFLTTLGTRSYASASPKYVTASSRVSASGGASSANSGDTIADERFDSIVVIRNVQSAGTGFYVTPDLILTAYHVVEGNALVELTFYDGTKSYGRLIDHDVRLDLALIRPQTAGKPLKIHSGPLRLGETVEAIGHPKGYEFTITRGVISAVRKQRSASIASGNLVEFVQTDTPISNGNSGGPLMLKDAVVGVNDWIRVDKGAQNLNFSVSYNEIRNYLDRFKGQ